MKKRRPHSQVQESQLSGGLASWESPEPGLWGTGLSGQAITGFHCTILRAPEERGCRATGPPPTLCGSEYVCTASTMHETTAKTARRGQPRPTPLVTGDGSSVPPTQ